MKKPPFTPAELAYLVSEAKRWVRTGFGVDPNQAAFRHTQDELCGCHQCAGTPITYTTPPAFTHQPLWAPLPLYGRRLR